MVVKEMEITGILENALQKKFEEYNRTHPEDQIEDIQSFCEYVFRWWIRHGDVQYL